ncbi:hypothetical protein BKA67DRAFT_407790 [Truncatella angustata]|uniref:Uncharacterized protein n=1 Tax=Truncatella angustata TaxID=152316 RepID=A0A9P8UDX2_9PEZI|nr:uncharacterized protein BKA67DRAFT_407790 [Truncatella angustata]KAH6648140.1 hypothetical protein BKA67DRAFT_407790 [Truncatella angustata]
MHWSSGRQTTKAEDAVYCLLGIFNVNIPLIYGEGKTNAMNRLLKAIEERTGVPYEIQVRPPQRGYDRSVESFELKRPTGTSPVATPMGDSALLSYPQYQVEGDDQQERHGFSQARSLQDGCIVELGLEIEPERSGGSPVGHSTTYNRDNDESEEVLPLSRVFKKVLYCHQCGCGTTFAGLTDGAGKCSRCGSSR